MVLIEQIKRWVKKQCTSNGINSVYIKGMWGIQCNFQPHTNERKFCYNIIVTQTLGQGACYYEKPFLKRTTLKNLCGTKYSFENNINRAIEISILDSIASTFNINASEEYILEGLCDEKATQRAEIIINEINRIVEIFHLKNPLITNIGVVSILILRLLNRGFIVSCSDKDDQIVDKILHEKVKVENSTKTLDLVKKSDIAVVTGMTLSTYSLNDIIKVAKEHNTKIIVFAQTGSSFAPYYISSGVSSVISEPFPFYTFDGKTKINIYRVNQ